MPDADLHRLFNLPATDIEFDDMQQQAISACCNIDKRIVAVTGKAGTGKTLIMREVSKRLIANGLRCAISRTNR
jgi:Cdc6-like AAA superfamily ATPase